MWKDREKHMAIELLDEKKQWGKIKAGLSGGGTFYRNPSKPDHHPFKTVKNWMQDQMGKWPLPTFTGKKK